MKTQYYTATSIDGFIADEHHSLEWLFQFGDEGDPDFSDFMNQVGAIAMGSSTYEWVLSHEIRPAGAPEKPWPYRTPAWVFSTRSLPQIADADIRFVSGNVVPVHEEMRAAAGEKNIWIIGGGDLVGQFHDAGLLDELILFVAPVTLGSGAPLLPRTITNPPLNLIRTTRHGPFVELRYAVASRS